MVALGIFFPISFLLQWRSYRLRAISDPPLRAFKMIAILAALGHASFLPDDLFRGRYCYRFFICRFGNRFW